MITTEPWTVDNNFFSVNVNMNLNLNLCVRRNSRDQASQYRRRNIKSKESPRKYQIPNKLTQRENFSKPTTPF